MQPFILKTNDSFDESDFIDHPVWATYYEPDDIQSAIELGFDAEVVRGAIAATGYSDSYSFALPAKASDAPFHYLYLSIRATTAGGRQLIGYVTGACLGLFFDGKTFLFNRRLADLCADDASKLAMALGEENVFPVQLEIVATSERRVFDF